MVHAKTRFFFWFPRCFSPQKRDEATGEVVVAAGDWDSYGVRIASRNTFPTAAGLASSAAGLACLSKYSMV